MQGAGRACDAGGVSAATGRLAGPTHHARAPRQAAWGGTAVGAADVLDDAGVGVLGPGAPPAGALVAAIALGLGMQLRPLDHEPALAERADAPRGVDRHGQPPRLAVVAGLGLVLRDRER